MPQPGQVSLQQDRSVLLGKGFTCSLGFFGVPGSTWRNTAVFPLFCLGRLKELGFFGEPEAERGRTEAYKYLGERQGGKLFTSTQEQCWHKNVWAETSRNKLGLEMQRFPSSVGELSVCIKGAGIKA